ncbi:MAG: hypothetical protein D6B26_02265, partial [Spirochaetaceae bacterium]
MKLLSGLFGVATILFASCTLMRGPDIVVVQNDSSYTVTVSYKGGTNGDGSIAWVSSSFEANTDGEITDAQIDANTFLIQSYSPGDTV